MHEKLSPTLWLGPIMNEVHASKSMLLGCTGILVDPTMWCSAVRLLVGPTLDGPHTICCSAVLVYWVGPTLDGPNTICCSAVLVYWVGPTLGRPHIICCSAVLVYWVGPTLGGTPYNMLFWSVGVLGGPHTMLFCCVGVPSGSDIGITLYNKLFCCTGVLGGPYPGWSTGHTHICCFAGQGGQTKPRRPLRWWVCICDRISS